MPKALLGVSLLVLAIALFLGVSYFPQESKTFFNTFDFLSTSPTKPAPIATSNKDPHHERTILVIGGTGQQGRGFIQKILEYNNKNAEKERYKLRSITRNTKR